MPVEQSSRLCPQCGSTVPPSKGVKPRKFCSKACTQEWHASRKNEANRKATASRRDKAPIVDCPHCGKPFHKENPSKVFCSDKCRHTSRKKRLAVESRERMKKLLSDDSYKEKLEKKRHELRERQRRTKNSRRCRHDAHVKLWVKLGLDWRKQGKHNAHVSTWINWRRSLSAPDAARYYKRIGKPWLNHHLTERAQYVIRYRLDLEYRLGEINRQSWRKEKLKQRDDGTQNFWVLLRERKTCPYCGTKITKENACADHMDPIKHGGANSQHNLTICCKPCNMKKSGRPFVEWLDILPADRRNAALLWYKRKHGHGPEQSSLCFTFAA